MVKATRPPRRVGGWIGGWVGGWGCQWARARSSRAPISTGSVCMPLDRKNRCAPADPKARQLAGRALASRRAPLAR